MFSALAGAYMAAKVHFAEMKNNVTRKQDQQISEYIYKNKVDKADEKEKYKKSKLPESGYMTVAEYEQKSRAQTKKEISAKILDKADMPKDENMVYIPQHKFKLVKYNDPPGSPELSLPRKLNFDRQINAQGIVSGDYSRLVYPSVYYYAQTDCTSCDLFVINLDSSLSNIEKVKQANVVNKEPKPILSTDKSVDNKFVFRTLTPIDFSSDNKKLAIKEKIGYKHDGIWKTELWVYDFETKEARKLSELREAITHYWFNKNDVEFDEKRWDIYPMGFDANNNNRLVVCAYAYTGSVPKFLGTWSIDIDGNNAKLEDLSGSYIPVATVGFRLVQDSEVIPPSEVKFDAKQAKNLEKSKKKSKKSEERFEKSQKRLEYRREQERKDMETLLKVKERQNQIKEYKKNAPKSVDGITGD